MATHAKTYTTAICLGCGKESIVRTDSKRLRCNSCAKKGNKNPSKQKLSNRSFIGSIEEYKRLHKNVQIIRGRAKSCVNGCEASKYQWANLTGDYTNVWDYIALCVSCHSKYDHGQDILP